MVEAGSALAIDREKFSNEISNVIVNHPSIELIREEVKDLISDELTIVATGPLTSENLTDSIIEKTERQNLSFFDAIAPIVYADSINENLTWHQSRYDKGDTLSEKTAYLNCPMDKNQYYNFVKDLKAGQKLNLRTGNRTHHTLMAVYQLR